MKKHSALLFLLLFTACQDIFFKEPQPKGKDPLKEVPRALHGSYLVTDNNGATKDTLVINANGYIVNHDPNERKALSDTLILKHFKGYYFANSKEHGLWVLRVLKRQSNGDLDYLALEGRDDKDLAQLVKRLARHVKVDSASAGSTTYTIDPSPKELVALIRDGYFKKYVFTKIK